MGYVIGYKIDYNGVGALRRPVHQQNLTQVPHHGGGGGRGG